MVTPEQTKLSIKTSLEIQQVYDRIREAVRIELERAGMSCCYVVRHTAITCIREHVSAHDLGQALATHQRWTGPPIGCTYSELGERIYRRLEGREDDG